LKKFKISDIENEENSLIFLLISDQFICDLQIAICANLLSSDDAVKRKRQNLKIPPFCKK
jgi:hypothetical protein